MTLSNNFEKICNYTFNVCVIVVIIAIIFKFYVRLEHGIDFVDETWHIADPYLVAKGAVPFATLWSQATGSVFPLGYIYKLFLWLNGSNEGLVIFTRRLYLFWVLLIITSIYFIFKSYFKDNDIHFVYFLPLLFIYSPGYVYAINYNSIGCYYLPLVLSYVLLFAQYPTKFKHLLIFALMGVISGRMIIGTPVTLFAVFLLSLYAFIYNKKALLFFVAGLVICAFIVILNAIILTDFSTFWRTLHHILNDQYYFELAKEYPKSWKLIAKFLVPSILYFSFFALIKIFLKVYNQGRYIYFFKIIVKAVLIPSLVLSFYFLIQRRYEYFVAFSWFIAALLLIFCSNEFFITRKVITIGIVAYFILGITFNLHSYIGLFGYAMQRYYWLIPFSFVSIYAFFYIYFSNKFRRVCAIVGFIFFNIFLLNMANSETYNLVNSVEQRDQDNKVKNLNARIDSGVLKGIYSTEIIAKSAVELENFLKVNTHDDECNLYLDWGSVGYLLGNGSGCVYNALEGFVYEIIGKELNTPAIFSYFNDFNKLPNKVIYIRKGHFPTSNGFLKYSSIENSNLELTKFVLKNYQFDTSFKNDYFDVLVYNIKQSDD